MKYGKIPAGRPGQPDDIAGPALFLCSEDCAYVTGQILSVDGGPHRDVLGRSAVSALA